MITLFLASTLALSSPAADTWQTLKPAGGYFSVSMPAKATAAVQTSQVPMGGTVTLHQYQVQAGGRMYMVQDATMSEAIAKAAPDAMLDAVVNSFGNSMGGKKVSSGKISFQGYPGRSMVFDRENKRVRGITVLAGTHNYTVVFGGPVADATGPDAKRFFGSFKILKGVK